MSWRQFNMFFMLRKSAKRYKSELVLCEEDEEDDKEKYQGAMGSYRGAFALRQAPPKKPRVMGPDPKLSHPKDKKHGIKKGA